MDGLLFDTECIYQQTWQEIAREKGVKLDGSGKQQCRPPD